MDFPNVEVVNKGFRILRDCLSVYIARELGAAYGVNWWQRGVMDKLLSDQRRDLPEEAPWGKLVDSLDITNCLTLIAIVHWKEIFGKKLSIEHRNWATELKTTRNQVAHIGGEDFSPRRMERALDTMAMLTEQIDYETSEEIRKLSRVAKYGSEEGSTAVKTIEAAMPNGTKPENKGMLEKSLGGGLPAWRELISPHPDVAQGRYNKAEFAADLAQVARGEGGSEYTDPVEFFSRTYITAGMTSLLVQALKRLSGSDGDPVIQLKTSFGGGKTHSLLALYHLMRGKVTLDRIPTVKPILDLAGVDALPQANVAVIVGTALDPTKSKRPPNMPGITINTLWGEIAAQLCFAKGDFAPYEIIKEADKRGISPGSEALKKLFDACGPCLVLMDELVAYAKKLPDREGLPAGTFDNFIVFIQEITEAARASQNSLVVASIPESDIEIGGDFGRRILAQIEHTFGRMQTIWRPVDAAEGFEIVRRRLFLDCQDPDKRDQVCKAFSDFYHENQSDFPLEAREQAYLDRMISCYPIHPEVFDRLYDDWATINQFQRTRGVLRFMATVIFQLWMGNDGALMILPGSIPLENAAIRDELTRYLPDNWNAIVDTEVDGKKSTPYQKDRAEHRYGAAMAVRRVARTIFLGSAPGAAGQTVRGIDESRIRLGVLQPGENIALFNDARNVLVSSLSYLYSSNGRYWYDTKPTLRKVADDRARQIREDDIHADIEKRLRKMGANKGAFAAIHVCPQTSSDVLDDQSVRLVILRPNETHRQVSKSDSAAVIRADDFLLNRGQQQRAYRNMLVFLAPDADRMDTLKPQLRQLLAWESIDKDQDALNLDKAQIRNTKDEIARYEQIVADQLRDAYQWLLVPRVDLEIDLNKITFDTERLLVDNDALSERVYQRMKQSEQLIDEYAPALLKIELDKLLWRDDDDLQIKKLWEFFSSYCYLPRLLNESVLLKTIRRGANSEDYFAYAAGKDGSRYLELTWKKPGVLVEKSGYIVKPDVARKQLLADLESGRLCGTGGGSGPFEDSDSSGYEVSAPVLTSSGMKTEASPEPSPKNRRFYFSKELDKVRINREVQGLVEEIIQHLTRVDDAAVTVTLEVDARSMTGFDHQTIRTVTENCRALGIRDFGVED